MTSSVVSSTISLAVVDVVVFWLVVFVLLVDVTDFVDASLNADDTTVSFDFRSVDSVESLVTSGSVESDVAVVVVVASFFVFSAAAESNSAP